MPHCAIYKDETDDIIFFIRDCVIDQGNYRGSNVTVGGIKFANAKEKWTNDEIERLPDGTWNKRISELVGIASPPRRVETSEEDFKIAITRRDKIVGMTYAQLDTYIDNNVTDLASAKAYLKRLSEVVLAMAKMMDRRGK